MGTAYTKTSPTNFVDGETINASDFTTEFNAIDATFETGGHQHDGTDGEGGAIEKLLSNAITFGTGADTDIAITFNANTADGVLTWMEDEDYFQFSDDLLISTTEKIQFRDTAIYIHSSADGQLDLVADTEIQIAATTVDLNGNLDVSGTIVSGGTLTATTSIGIGSAVLTEAELEMLDGITAGTAAASKAVVLSADKDIATVRNVTSNGTVQFGSLSDGTITATAFVDEDDMASNSAALIPTQQSVKAYVDGSAQTMGDGFVLEDGDGTEVTITENKEVKFVEGGGVDIDWTDTDNGTDADPYDLTFTIVAAQTGITSVTNAALTVGRDADNDIDFATDNNIIFRAAGADQVKIIDGVLAPVSDNDVDLGSSGLQFKDAYIHGTLEADAITLNGTALGSTFSAIAGSSSIVTTGALDSGSITSGFGTINNGSSTITTTGAVSGGSFVVPDDGDIGSASATDAIQISSGGIVTFKDDIKIKDGGTIGVASAADAMTVSSAGIVTFKDDILIKDGGTIGVASDADVITIASTGVTTFSKAVVGSTDTDTSNTGSVTLDFNTNQNFVLTFTGNVTLANPSTESVGQTGVITCIQDGTGSRTLSLGTDYETVGGAGITLSTGANSVDVIPYAVKASGSIQLGAPQLAFS
tara:strand:+ start:1707 stop:3644 length:1938 start_codon:yes stop_codon:yes gene_type:complete